MLIVDAHLDLSWNALQWNRDLLASVYTLRTRENRTAGKGRGLNTVALPEMRRGRVALSIVTLLARSTGQALPHIDYGSTAQAYAIAQGQLAYYRALEDDGHVRVLTNASELDGHMAEWSAWDAANPDPTDRDTPPLGFVISMEGADPIVTPDQLEGWWALGLRLLGITHYGPGRYAGGTGTELGLTDLGKPLLAEMERVGVLLDLTHCSDEAFWQCLDLYGGRVLASHNNCRALVEHQRQFSDDQLKAVIERDGVIGVALDTWMLQAGWVIGETTNENVSLATVVDHIDHVCQLAGNAQHVAIGSDLDGGFGREQSPHDLDTIVDLQRIAVILAERGYAAADIDAVMHGNWVRFLRESWD